jgi:hypothetical protein
MLDEAERHQARRRRVEAAHEQHTEYEAAVGRIIDQGRSVPDPAGRRARCAA